MSGLEIFGAIGTAVSVIEGIVAAKSYISDFRNSTKEREQIKNELQRIDRIVVNLESVITAMPHDNSWDSLLQAFSDFKLSVAGAQSVVQESSSRITWKADKVKIKDMQNQCERLGTLLNVSFASYNTVNEPAHIGHKRPLELNKINKNIDMLRVCVDIERLHAMQNWLTSNYNLEDELSELRKVRKPHSGKWLLDSEIFQNWLAGTDKVVVLRGPHMTQKLILCRILSFALGRSTFSSSTRGLPIEVPSGLLALYQRRKLEEANIQQITSALLHSMNGPLYIVLDALDELSGSPRNDLISLLADLSSDMRLFITTRPLVLDYPHVSYPLNSSNLHDLKSYIHAEVESLDYAMYGEQEDVSSLKEIVMTKSSELFLLASLHIRELKCCLDMDDALEVAEKLPTTDKTCYSRSLDRIRSRDSRRATTAIHCLVWVWQAKRKLTLEELQTAVASSTRDLTNRSVNRALVPRHQLLDLCDGLLVMGDRDDYVAFVHLTARQFFDEDANPDILEIRSNLGTSCLGILNALHSSTTILKWSEQASQCSFNGDSQGRGFFDYASRFWGEHQLAGVKTHITELRENVSLFPVVASLRAAEILANQPFRDSTFCPLNDISWLHIAASFALTNYLTTTIDLASKC
ncbi:hypothetical protein DL96DRAFT_1557450 [Flagelloscypha sp. PMI_526]|nr:hypothetical protein DL96DRAFT_1557450 [Flagelloscypha sp. PMI_526]